MGYYAWWRVSGARVKNSKTSYLKGGFFRKKAHFSPADVPANTHPDVPDGVFLLTSILK